MQLQIIKLSAILHWGSLEKDLCRPAVQTERVGAGGAFSRTPYINLFWAASQCQAPHQDPSCPAVQSERVDGGGGSLGDSCHPAVQSERVDGGGGSLGDSCRPAVQSERVDGGVGPLSPRVLFCLGPNLANYIITGHLY